MGEKKLAKKDMAAALSNLKKAGIILPENILDQIDSDFELAKLMGIMGIKDDHDAAERLIHRAYMQSNFPSRFEVKDVPSYVKSLDYTSPQHLLGSVASSGVKQVQNTIKNIINPPPPDFDTVLKKLSSDKKLSPEQLNELIASSLRLSLGPDMDIEKRGGFTNQTGRIGRTWDRDLISERFPLLEKVDIDGDRSIGIRKGYGDELMYSADKGKDVIANITLDPTGHIGMISSGKRGIYEEATPRLILEAVKRGQVPHSSNLLGPGQKFVQRMADEFKSPNFINLLKKLKETGKFGEYWSAAAPLLKTTGKVGLPLAAAYSNYSEAKEEGLPTPLAVAYAAGEELNPTPISGIDFYKGMEKAAEGRRSNIEQNYMPEEMKAEQKALADYKNSPAAKHRKFARIKELLK